MRDTCVQKSCVEVRRTIRRFLSRFPHGVTGISFVFVMWTIIDKQRTGCAFFVLAIFFFEGIYQMSIGKQIRHDQSVHDLYIFSII